MKENPFLGLDAEAARRVGARLMKEFVTTWCETRPATHAERFATGSALALTDDGRARARDYLAELRVLAVDAGHAESTVADPLEPPVASRARDKHDDPSYG